jgi:hypothetical protein
MDSVETLLAEYVAEHRSGGKADPVEYLSRAAPAERRELATLIDGFLARSPRAPLAPQPSPDPRAEATIEALSRSIGGESGLWPALLPRLRDRAGLKRRELVERLAKSLGVSDRVPKVERYYHEMELGLLPARGVSDRVLEALAKLVGVSASELRSAGATLGGAAGAGAPKVEAFARTASIDALAAPAPEGASSETPERWDEVDELFRSGG